MSEIRIYPSIIRSFQGAPTQHIETHLVESGTLTDWLLANVPSYADNPGYNPWEVELESARGTIVTPEKYSDVALADVGVVHLYMAPQGGVVSSVFDAVVDLFSSVFSWLMPDIPTPNANGQIDQGAQINDPSVTVNRPKLNGVINQVAGQVKLAPYYLAPPHSYFTGPRTKCVDILLCVGWGRYALPASQIRIGETPIGALGNDVDWQAYEPGEWIGGHRAHELWYTAPEVGAAGNGQAGLKLKSTIDITQRLTATYIDVSSSTITVPAGAEIPLDWTPELLLNVAIQRQVVASAPVDPDVRAVYSGSFSDLGLAVGDSIVMRDSAIAGEYVVYSVTANELTLSYPDLSPVTSPTGGTYSVSVDRFGARYRIVSVGTDDITVEKQLADGNPDTGWLGWSNARYHRNWRITVDDIYAEGDWLGPFNAQKPGTLVNRLNAVVLMPRGLGLGKDNGDVESRTRNIELQWRALDDEEWIPETLAMTDASRDQLGFTIDVDLPQAMAVECRLRRLEPEDADVRAFDEMQWTQLSSRLAESPTSYADITVLAMTITGSDAIAGQSENRVTCVPTSILPTMDGGPWQPTRAIADWVRHAANQVGITDDDIDMDELQRLHDTWTARGDTFDFNHDSDDTVKAVLQRALKAGFAQLTWDDVLVPVRDEPRTQLEQMYSPQNMRADALLSKSIRSIRPDDYDGVDVEYQSAITATVETVECRLSGSTGERIETIRIEGVGDETRAWRHGMRRLMWHRYVRKGYSWGTPTDALNSRMGSYCPVVGPIPSRAQSAQIEQVVVNSEGVNLLVNEALNWDGIEQHVIYWRKPDGVAAGPYPATRGEDDYHVIAAMGSDLVPEVDPTKEPPHLMFGRVEHVLIKIINPSGMSSVSVEAEGYDARLYQFDDAVPG